MSHFCRRGVLSLFAAFLLALAMVPVARAQPAGVPVVDLDGRGWGHGVGLSQWGARYMADAGQGHDEILSRFYPGTALSTTSASEIRVAVYNAPDGRATLTFPNGGQILSSPSGEQAAGFPVDVAPGDSAVVTYDGSSYSVSPVVRTQAATSAVRWEAPSDQGCIPLLGQCPPAGGGGTNCGALGCTGGTTPPTTDPTTTAPPTSTDGSGDTTIPDGTDTPPSASQSGAASPAPVWAAPARGGTVGVNERGRHYRGLIEATAGGGPLRLVNQLDVETYLKGMGEVPGSWPIEAVGAQAVVARTYALRAMSASGELCDDDLCQVYIGADNESPGQNAGVNATAGEVLTYAGALATTVYSADAGGISATTLEGFGTADDGRYPYLTTVRYDTPNPLPWHSEIALSDIANRLGYSGTLDSVSIGSAGPSGRALTVTLRGSNGDAAVDGREFAASLGLRSTLFTPTVGTADTAPAAPTAAAPMQVLPDDASALHRAALEAARPAATGRSPRPASTAVVAPARVSKSVSDFASRPASWAVLALLVVVTAVALGGLGEAEPAPLGVRLGRVLPTWTQWTWADARVVADGWREWMGQRRLAKERAAAAAIVIPAPVEPSDDMTAVDTVARTALLDEWAPLFAKDALPRRREPLRATRSGPPRPRLRLRRR